MKPWFPLLCLLVTPIALAQQHAHVHGIADMNLVLEGNTLSIDLESPMDNTLGFEHPPKSAAEKQAVAAMQQTLQQSDRLFRINAEAGCKAAAPQIESALFSGQVNGHADLDASYTFTCAHPEALRNVDVQLFTVFPRLKSIKLQKVTAKGQQGRTLTPEQHRIEF